MPSRRIVESWLKSITPYSFPPSELSERLLHLGLEMEVVEDRNRGLAGFVVGEVLAREKHPNADKLSLCTVSTGAEQHTVVCGAPNVAAGQKIAFAPVGTYIAAADFTIARRKIRGIESEGMICSEQELGLGDDHDGILVLSEDAPVGAPLADVLGEVIYEVDLTPNRADCLSHLGIAREVAAMTGETVFLPPATFTESGTPASDVVSVEIDDPALCPRYVARVVNGVKVGPSPMWLQEIIRKLGLRPRNNIVDITSYVLFECGHPLHAFDLNKVAGSRVVVRTVSGETFVTLDGKEHELPADTLMICDAEKPIAIAGIMGGENSEIGDDTVDVLIESAYFLPSSIRRSAKRLGISTDASYRFERGADIDNTIYAVNRAASMIAGIAGGEVLAGMVDVYPNPEPQKVIELRYERTGAMLGVEIDPSEQAMLLGRLGFGVESNEPGRAMVTVPSYRVDVFGEVDLIEEVARLYGYDRISAEPRAMVSFDTSTDAVQKLTAETRRFFVDNGFTEIVGLYLTDPETATQYGKPIALRNALGRDFSMLRTSLVPTVAKVVGLNQRHSRPDQRLFEVGTAFRAGRPDQGLVPGVVETLELSLVLAGRAEPWAWDVAGRGQDLYDLRGTLDRYFSRIGLRGVEYRSSDTAQWGVGAPALAIWAAGEEIGRVGPIDSATIQKFDIDGSPVVALFDLTRIAGHAFADATYVPPSKFPTVARDISIVVDAAAANAAIEGTIRRVGGGLLTAVTLFDLYAGKGVPEGKKSLAYSLTLTPTERTMEDAEVEALMKRIVAALAEEHRAELRG